MVHARMLTFSTLQCFVPGKLNTQRAYDRSGSPFLLHTQHSLRLRHAWHAPPPSLLKTSGRLRTRHAPRWLAAWLRTWSYLPYILIFHIRHAVLQSSVSGMLYTCSCSTRGMLHTRSAPHLACFTPPLCSITNILLQHQPVIVVSTVQYV
jgi:hypothetical protein